jgi:periplasmic protein TonB
MDEIVFEFRNKNYGAYILRKLYNKHVTESLFLAVFMLCAGLCYPFISGFYAKSNGRLITDGVNADFINPPPVDKVDPPPLPPPAIDMKRLVFLPPQVTEGEVPADANLNMDDINRSYVNVPVTTIEPAATTETPPVLDVEPEMKIETIVQEMPAFIGGEPALYQFISDNIRYPQLAKETNVQGTVYVSFVVDTRGHVIKVKLLRGIGGGCDDEALRVISMLPDWTPGKQNGRAANVLYNMPIVFKLGN